MNVEIELSLVLNLYLYYTLLNFCFNFDKDLILTVFLMRTQEGSEAYIISSSLVSPCKL